MNYLERRRICRDYHRKCRKGWLDRIRGRFRRGSTR